MPDLRPVEEALDKLAALGSAEHIRLHFADIGIVACPRVSDRCAVAVYLQQEVGGWFSVAQQSTRDRRWNEEPGCHYVENPPAVREFIGKFDQHQYPELEAPRA